MSTMSELSTLLACEGAAATRADKAEPDTRDATEAALDAPVVPNGTPIAAGRQA